MEDVRKVLSGGDQRQRDHVECYWNNLDGIWFWERPKIVAVIALRTHSTGSKFKLKIKFIW